MTKTQTKLLKRKNTKTKKYLNKIEFKILTETIIVPLK